MKWKFNWANIACGLIAILGIMQFVSPTFHAITVYPDGYNFTEHFLSDLGRTDIATPRSSLLNLNLFNRSLIVLGMSLIPFFFAVSSSLEKGQTRAAASGVSSAIGLIGIGCTPYDVFQTGHLMSLGLWLFSTLVLAGSFCVYAQRGEAYSKLLIAVTLSVFAAAGCYVTAGSQQGHVIFQKILVVLTVIWFFLVFLTISMATFKVLVSGRNNLQDITSKRLSRAIDGQTRRLSLLRLETPAAVP